MARKENNLVFIGLQKVSAAPDADSWFIWNEINTQHREDNWNHYQSYW
jgi:hypothetical protein